MPTAARKLCHCGRIRNADEACACGAGSRRSSTYQSSPLYKTRRWINRSKRHREANPTCVFCEREGRVVPAAVADHITPWTTEAEFYEGEIQSLCLTHHGRKSASERKSLQLGQKSITGHERSSGFHTATI
jgi:hypothetical protein